MEPDAQDRGLFLRTLMAVLYSRHEIKNHLSALRGHLELWEIALAKEGEGDVWRHAVQQEHNVDMIIDVHDKLHTEVAALCRSGPGFIPKDAETRRIGWLQSLHYIQTWLKVLHAGCSKLEAPPSLPEEDRQADLQALCARSVDALEIFLDYIETGRMGVRAEPASFQSIHHWLNHIATPMPGIRTVTDFTGVAGTCPADKRLLALIQRNAEQNAQDALSEGTGRDGQDPCFTIRTRADRTEEGEGLFVIEYADNGQGIPEADQRRVFELFFTKGKNDGTGIGLALVAEAAHQLEGALDLISSDRGTTLVLKLPATLKN